MLAEHTKRLAHLRGLSDGWLDGHGKAPTGAAETSIRAVLDQGTVGSCGLTPTEEGGILLETFGDRWDVGIEAASDGSLSLYGVEKDGPGEIPEATFGSDAVALCEAAAPYLA